MLILALLILVALAFDYINGFHDAANSIATVVSTRVLSPRAAVAWAAFFNFIAFLLFHSAVAASIAKGVDPSAVTLNVVFATLIGAITWNLVTWYYGIPSSSSHALLGAFAGAAVANAGTLSVLNAEVYRKTAVFIVASPLIGALCGYLMMRFVRFVARDWAPSTV